MEPSDKHLWLGWLRQGDDHAFEALVRPHMAFALDFARRMGCTREQADDVLQNCLTRLAGERDSRPIRVGIRAWIGRSVSLEARMLTRAEGRRARRERAWEPFVSDDVSIDARMAEVERGIDQLTPAQREVVWLRYRHDCDYREIAQILGVSENACRLRVHKAMRDLRTRLGPDAGSLIATLPLLAGTGREGLVAAALATAAHGAPATVASFPALAAGLALLAAAGLVTWLVVGGEEAPAAAPQLELIESARVSELPITKSSGPQQAQAPGDPPQVRPGGDGATRPSAVPSSPGGVRLGTTPRPFEERFAPPTWAPVRPPVTPFFSSVLTDPSGFRDLVLAAREYFDLGKAPWKGRNAFLDVLTREAAAGRYWLQDMTALRWLVSQGRFFNPPMTDRKWRTSVGISEYKRLGGTLHRIKSEDLSIALSIPKNYPSASDLRSRFPRVAPYPLLLTMHEKRDYTGRKYPGQALLTRRYPQKAWKELYEHWVVLCPIAAAGNYVSKEGMIRASVFQSPYSHFWKHYHVDFERVILDGTEQAFTAAASQAIFFSGIVFRSPPGKKWGLSTKQKRADVQNFSTVPVYVVDNVPLARQLREAGHHSVTAGPDGPDLLTWMKARKRVAPKKFRWTAQRVDQVLPYWVNLEAPNWSAAERTIDVEVLDTEREPNTIRIAAVGIDSLALFLNDEIVDLNRKVRVVINGHVEFSEKITPATSVMQKLGRDFDLLFDRDPTRIRLSMFFGWLKTARIVQVRVRPPDTQENVTRGPAEPNTAPVATAAEEVRAARLLAKARKYLEKGLQDKARSILEKLLLMAKNKSQAEAQRLLQHMK